MLVLTGANNYGGGTMVMDGELDVMAPAALPAGSSLMVGDGALQLFPSHRFPAPPIAKLGLGVTAVPEPKYAGRAFGRGCMRRGRLSRRSITAEGSVRSVVARRVGRVKRVPPFPAFRMVGLA